MRAFREVGRAYPPGLLTLLDGLPARYGDALEWKYVEGLPVVEIAARLAVSPKAAESLLTRAREAFRDAFATLAENDKSRRARVSINFGPRL